jgi:acyl-CoA reductase-like NAD-dependent aldehyde dehydrogenase
VLFGAFRSTGQKCTATSRLILADSVADEFLERLTLRLSGWLTGDPVDPDIQMGPVINEAARRSITSGINAAVKAGAVAIAGTSAENPFAGTPGAFIAPTVLELPTGQVGSTNLAWREELFGPVLAVRRAATPEEAFGLAEESEFGLSAAFFTVTLRQCGKQSTPSMWASFTSTRNLLVRILMCRPADQRRAASAPRNRVALPKTSTHTTTVYLHG